MAIAVSLIHLGPLGLPEFKPDSRWIANVLGVSPDDVNAVLQRLLRLGLLEITNATHWRDRSREGAAAGVGQPLATVIRLLEQVRRLSSVVAPNQNSTTPRRTAE